MQKILDKRYKSTLALLQKHIPAPATLLDLGIDNPLSAYLRDQGYTVINTGGEDLDLVFASVKRSDVDAVTAFEILEHLVAPFNVLNAIDAKMLVATVPMRLWYARAYWNDNDPWDRHFHEFEDRQFDMLLEKARWKLVERQKWISPSYKLGFRTILRNITPRYYAVVAKR